MKGPTFGQSVSFQVCSKLKSFLFRDLSTDMLPAAAFVEVQHAPLLKEAHQVLGESRCAPTR